MAKENLLENSPQRNILVDEVTLRDNDLCVPEVRDVGEKTLDQWVYFLLKLVENFKMAYLVGACEVFSSAVLSLDSVMGKE